MDELVPEQRIARELGSGEHLLWSGRPRQGLMLRASDTLLIPFSLLWCGFAIFWEGSAMTTSAPFFFKLWGIPFVGAGIYMVVGRFFVDACQRKNTSYGVTSTRVIIVSRLFSESVQSLPLRTISNISLSERSDGAGTIVLGPTAAGAAFAVRGWPGTQQYIPPALEGIPQARVVHEIIRRAQNGAA